jgi:hypothetical protein
MPELPNVRVPHARGPNAPTPRAHHPCALGRIARAHCPSSTLLPHPTSSVHFCCSWFSPLLSCLLLSPSSSSLLLPRLHLSISAPWPWRQQLPLCPSTTASALLPRPPTPSKPHPPSSPRTPTRASCCQCALLAHRHRRHPRGRSAMSLPMPPSRSVPSSHPSPPHSLATNQSINQSIAMPMSISMLMPMSRGR